MVQNGVPKASKIGSKMLQKSGCIGIVLEHIPGEIASRLKKHLDIPVIGIGAGMILAGSSTIMFMQNAGFANSISTITSLIQLYQIRMIFLIGWRGYLKNDAPEHEKIGKIQPELLQSLNLENRILTEKTWEKDCKWALSKIKKNTPVALIIRREFLD